MAFVEFVSEHYDLIIGVGSLVASAVGAVVFIIRNRKRIKNAKTDEDRTAIVNDLKSEVYGFISIAEGMFSDVPKSGSAKLLYVLNRIKPLCTACGIDFDEEFWTGFINDIVAKSNTVIEDKEIATAKARIIESIKAEITYMLTQMNELFASIPDSKEYKIEYLLKFIQTACAKHSIDVYDSYDWRGYVINLFEGDIAV